MKSTTSYLGVKSPNPPNVFIMYRQPTINDIEPCNIGDFWIIPKQKSPLPSLQVWELVDMQQNQATWVQLNKSESTVFLNHQILIGTGTTTIGQLPTGSAGQLLLSGGASADPSWNVSGTLNQVLHSGGAGMPPIWKGTGPSGAITNINVQYITATGSGTYTPTTGMIQCIVECIGGGGGAGGANTATDSQGFVASGGGGAGGYCRKLFTSTDIGSSQVLSIGTGGAGGIGANDGATGVATTFGTGPILTANGGVGSPQALTYKAYLGGLGGTATGGDINIQGQSGATASSYFVISQGGFSSSGIGANTIYGAGGAALNVESGNSDGNVGIGYGSGGGGAIIAFSTPPANQTGGAGAPGIVIVTEYIQ